MDVQQELRLAASGYAFGISDSSTISEFFNAPSVALAHQLEEKGLSLRSEHLSNIDLTELLIQCGKCLPHPKAKCGELSPEALLLRFGISITPHSGRLVIPSTLVANHSAPALKGLFLLGKQRGRIGDFQRSIMEETGILKVRGAIERRDAFMKRVN